MDLDAILDGIQKAGQQQIEQIEHEAERQSSQILAKIQKNADVQKKRILADGHARLNREQALIEQQAVIQSLQIHADARQKLIESVLKNVADRFSGIRSRKDYEQILSNLANETVQSIIPTLLNKQKIILHFDPKDKVIAERIVKKMEAPVSPEYDIECSGGCTAETEDSMVSVLNTVESRFEHAKPYVKQKLSLFFERKYSSS
jgi:vacuolar-type H+-ATPase subunit E/Vma4